MAIYDTGTASLSASGQVAGVGTQWTMPLTLIRVGATIIFKTEPVKIYTISEITSDTSLSVHNPSGETVPAGTGYAILAHDGISVQGLAQDVAETLRYYQSKETSIEGLLQFIGQDTFDWPRFEQLATQSTTGAAEALASQVAAAESASTAVDARDTTTAARDATIAAINGAGDAGTLVALANNGINTDNVPFVTTGDSFDWQTHNFISGQSFYVNTSVMVNTPQYLTFPTIVSRVWINCYGSRKNAVFLVRVVASTANNSGYREYEINVSGPTGSRTFSVREILSLPADGSVNGGASSSRIRDLLELGPLSTASVAPVTNGGTGANNASDARSNLGLGSASTLNTGNATGNVMRVGDFGLGKPDGASVFNTNSQDALLSGLINNGLTVFRNNQQIAAPWDIWNYSSSLFLRAGDTLGMISIPFETSGKIKVFGGTVAGGWTHARTVYDNLNSTLDTNGFLKTASPIVKVFKDGSFETNEQSAGATVERVSIGVYKVSGVIGLNSEALWGGVNGGFEIPVDINKQPRIWLDYEVESDGSIVVKTYHRTNDSSPSFASNKIEGFSNGDPIDIPSDSFVSIRVNMP